MDTQTFPTSASSCCSLLVGGVFAATEIALVSLRESQISAIERGSRPRRSGGRGGAQPQSLPRRRPDRRHRRRVLLRGVRRLDPRARPRAVPRGPGAGRGRRTDHGPRRAHPAHRLPLAGPRRAGPQAAGAAEGRRRPLAVAPVLDKFATVMRPVIWLLSLSTNALVRLLGGDPNATSEQLSEEELRDIVSTHDDLDEQQRRILSDVFAATETNVKEVMRPRGDVSFVDGELTLPEAALHVRGAPLLPLPDHRRGLRRHHRLPARARPARRHRRGPPRRVSEIASAPILTLPGTKPVLPDRRDHAAGGRTPRRGRRRVRRHRRDRHPRGHRRGAHR